MEFVEFRHLQLEWGRRPEAMLPALQFTPVSQKCYD